MCGCIDGHAMSDMRRTFHDVEPSVDTEPRHHADVIDDGSAHEFFPRSYQDKEWAEIGQWRSVPSAHGVGRLESLIERSLRGPVAGSRPCSGRCSRRLVGGLTCGAHIGACLAWLQAYLEQVLRFLAQPLGDGAHAGSAGELLRKDQVVAGGTLDALCKRGHESPR